MILIRIFSKENKELKYGILENFRLSCPTKILKGKHLMTFIVKA